MTYLRFTNKWNSFIGFRLMNTLLCSDILTYSKSLMKRRRTQW